MRAAEDLHELAQVLPMPGAPRTPNARARLLQTSTTDIEAMHLFAVACFALGTANDRAAGIEAMPGRAAPGSALVPAIHNMAVAYTQMRQWNRARYWASGPPAGAGRRGAQRLRMRLRLCVFADLWAGAVFIAGANPMPRASDAPEIQADWVGAGTVTAAIPLAAFDQVQQQCSEHEERAHAMAGRPSPTFDHTRRK